MTLYQFIFSERTSHRVARHAAFWIFFSLYIFLFRYYVYDLKYLFYTSTYSIRLENLLLFLPVSFFYAYFAIYHLLPAYILKGKYKGLMVIVLLLSVLLVLISYLASTIFSIRLAFDMPLNRATLVRQIDFTVNNGLVFPLTVSGFAIGIKMGKNFYMQQKINEQLAMQKIDAEVQLLKSRIHPRFLFHSLNSIYRDMLNGASQSPEMLLKLADLLSYILYESDSLMPLEKEISLLKSYIELEKISRGNSLIIQLKDEAMKNGKFIEPLLLLQLSEYVLLMQDADNHKVAFFTLEIQVVENEFYISITYESNDLDISLKDNVQLAQIKKRLKMHYNRRHNLKITNDINLVNVFLSLILNKTAASIPEPTDK